MVKINTMILQKKMTKFKGKGITKEVQLEAVSENGGAI